jgi:DNA-binding IclR family transcriptional regulator
MSRGRALTEAPPKASPYLSIQKAFRILEVLAAKSPQGVTEIAAALDLEKSSVSRLLKGLSELGYVLQGVRRGQYQVSPRILMLAQQYLEGDRLIREAQPVLRELALEARATAHLGVAVEGQTLIIAKEPSPERIQVATRVGAKIVPHASALGKALLASLPDEDLAVILARPLARFTAKTITDRKKLVKVLDDVRRKGYSLESEEEHPGVGCIGVPVRDSAGRWIAAISVAGPLGGTPFRLDAAHIKMVQDRAEELSERLSAGEERQGERP